MGSVKITETDRGLEFAPTLRALPPGKHGFHIHAEGISKADLEKTVGKPVETVPQIFVDQKHIGGCTDFEAWAKENLGLFA
ncbi:GrxA family glutaredoxin [Catenulispora yoronensis]|uniref:GrxA family glutaredoxin n=1 Tax=Catenulispora yoronensis TaxID=450799 RepID=UPI003CD09A04